MKSLLFLGTGAVLHSTGERNLGRLGGLIHRMPWVAWLTLVGRARDGGTAASQRLRLRVASAAGVSVRTRGAAHIHQHAAAAGAALVALAAALAAYVMVKFFGVIFLGQPREAALWHGRTTRGSSSASGCCGSRSAAVLLGLLPAYVIRCAARGG